MKCYNHLREASYAFSSVGGTIITKIQGELIEAYYKFAKSKDGGKGTGGFSNGTSRANKVNIPESSIKHSNVVTLQHILKQEIFQNEGWRTWTK